MDSFNGTIWAYQIVCKEDVLPSTEKVIFLATDSTIIDATRALADFILQDLANFGYEIEEKPQTPENLLGLLNRINDLSRSHFVVRIYPPGADIIQDDFKSWGNSRRMDSSEEDDPNAPERPPSAQLLWRRENRREIKRNNRDKTKKEIRMIIHNTWVNLANKKKYFDKEMELWFQYNKERVAYDLLIQQKNTK